MTDPERSFVCSRLARRVHETLPESAAIVYNHRPTPNGLLDYLRDRLSAGETHYTARQGIPELRIAIGREIGRRGGAECEANGVIVTHGEGEALYVTLLGLGLNTGSKLAVVGQCRHRDLLELLEIHAVDSRDLVAAHATAIYRELGAEYSDVASAAPAERYEIMSVNGLLFSAELKPNALTETPRSAILIGNLDSVAGLDHFRLGFVAGPPDLVKQIQTWKQALSICTAGPSQRAALFALELGGGS